MAENEQSSEMQVDKQTTDEQNEGVVEVVDEYMQSFEKIDSADSPLSDAEKIDALSDLLKSGRDDDSALKVKELCIYRYCCLYKTTLMEQ